MQFQLNLQNKYFNMIKNGKKTIELRLYDEKRKNIKVGDEILFSNNENEEKLLAKVLDLHKAKSFEDLVGMVEINKTGFSSILELNEALLEFYSAEKQKEFGVLGIEVELKPGFGDPFPPKSSFNSAGKGRN